MALAAEQDNRVKIPDGTAAVCVGKQTYGENRSLGFPREGQVCRQSCDPLPRHESEDLRG